MKQKLLFVLLFLPLILPAQTTIIFLDNTSQEPIPGVVVKSNNKNSYVSDDLGALTLDLSDPVEMIAAHISYENKHFSISPNEQIRVFLERAQVPLTEVVVSSFETERSLLEQAAAVHQIPESDLYRFNETSIVNVFMIGRASSRDRV